MKIIDVAGGDLTPYQVWIGEGLIDAAQDIERFAPRRRATVTFDARLKDSLAPRLIAGLAAKGLETRQVEVPSGEASKSWNGLQTLAEAWLDMDLDRKDVVVALGGGVTGDLVGFAAAIYKRGIDFIQVPTTLLAQVDSSVGGKTAIDTRHGKNLIGAFWQPRLVLCDLGALDTLPDRQMRAGYAEVIKYGLLGDAAFFAWLEDHGAAVLARERAPLAQAVAHSVQMKADIVGRDEREAGERALLNLGHTFGHALEAELGFDDALLHGEAVAVGAAQAFRFSARQGLCPAADAVRTEDALIAAGLPTRLGDIQNAPFEIDRLIAHMRQDKKASDGGLTLVLARGIGQAFTQKGVDEAALRAFLHDEGAAA